MKLSTHREEIRGRQSSLKRLRRFSTHLPFMLRTQFSYVTTLKTHFQIEVDKYVFHQKVNCYKGKKVLIEDNDEAPPTRYVKARLGRLFIHELEAED